MTRGLLSEFQTRFRQHSLSRTVDIAICTSPAVLLLIDYFRGVCRKIYTGCLSYISPKGLLSNDGKANGQLN